MESKIGDIKSFIGELTVVAIVKSKSAVRTFGNDGKYMSVELFDGEDIKLTLFCDDVSKGESLTVRIIYCFFMYLQCLFVLFLQKNHCGVFLIKCIG